MKNALVFLTFLSIFFELGCSNGQNGGFVSDASTASAECSSSGCATVDSSPYLTLKKSGTYQVKAADREVEINGDCYLADALSHYFTLSLTKNSTAYAASFRGLNTGDPGNTSIKCNQGKFSIILTVSGLAVGTYNLKGQMTLTQKDNTVVSPTSANFSLNISVN